MSPALASGALSSWVPVMWLPRSNQMWPPNFSGLKQRCKLSLVQVCPSVGWRGVLLLTVTQAQADGAPLELINKTDPVACESSMALRASSRHGAQHTPARLLFLESLPPPTSRGAASANPPYTRSYQNICNQRFADTWSVTVTLKGLTPLRHLMLNHYLM